MEDLGPRFIEPVIFRQDQEREMIEEAARIDDGLPWENPCSNHIPRQHRDGKPPWCKTCGMTRDHKAPISRLTSSIPKTVPMTFTDDLGVIHVIGEAHLRKNEAGDVIMTTTLDHVFTHELNLMDQEPIPMGMGFDEFTLEANLARSRVHEKLIRFPPRNEERKARNRSED